METQKHPNSQSNLEEEKQSWRNHMGFSRQEYWSGLPWPAPEDLPNLGIKPQSPALSGVLSTIWATREAQAALQPP